MAPDLGDLPPALIVIPTLDPIADQGRAYARRLAESGTEARVTEHPGAVHAFVSTPRLVPQARAARAEISAFLREHLALGERSGTPRMT
jgi:acetyl esterase/lipase